MLYWFSVESLAGACWGGLVSCLIVSGVYFVALGLLREELGGWFVLLWLGTVYLWGLLGRVLRAECCLVFVYL